MKRRHVLLVCLGLGAAAILALVLAGLRRTTIRTYALEVPNQFVLATLQPGRRACEGPVGSPDAFGGVSVWGAGAGGPAQVSISALDARTGVVLGSGQVTTLPVINEWTARLGRRIAAGVPVRVCVGDVRGAFVIAGAPTTQPDVKASGLPPGHQFSLLLLSYRERPLLSWLPLAFGRASLWRPSWVGAWTFWALVGGLLVAFGLVALAAAATGGDGSGPKDPPGPGDPTPSPNGAAVGSRTGSARR